MWPSEKPDIASMAHDTVRSLAKAVELLEETRRTIAELLNENRQLKDRHVQDQVTITELKAKLAAQGTLA